MRMSRNVSVVSGALATAFLAGACQRAESPSATTDEPTLIAADPHEVWKGASPLPAGRVWEGGGTDDSMTGSVGAPPSGMWHLDYEADCRHAKADVQPDVWSAGTSQVLRTGPPRVFWGAVPAESGKHVDEGVPVQLTMDGKGCHLVWVEVTGATRDAR